MKNYSATMPVFMGRGGLRPSPCPQRMGHGGREEGRPEVAGVGMRRRRQG